MAMLVAGGQGGGGRFPDCMLAWEWKRTIYMPRYFCTFYLDDIALLGY